MSSMGYEYLGKLGEFIEATTFAEAKPRTGILFSSRVCRRFLSMHQICWETPLLHIKGKHLSQTDAMDYVAM